MPSHIIQGLMDNSGPDALIAGLLGPASLIVLILALVAVRDLVLWNRRRRAMREPRQDEEWIP